MCGLTKSTKPAGSQVEDSLSGYIWRCGTYARIK